MFYLTTTGKKSGAKGRTDPLCHGRPRFAELWGRGKQLGTTNHPRWSFNLEANPMASIDIEGDSSDVVARRATDKEATRIWNAFDGVWPGYEKYREIAPRDIKVFVLEPARSLPE
jgi:deazaflavin-dependent oxidoreductase (nitroreductase family)